MRLPWYQSEHHSNTLPCMSYKLHGLGFFIPTLWAYCSRAALPGPAFISPFDNGSKSKPPHHAYEFSFDSSPNENAVVVPARHAYSHWASVGRRYSSSAFSFPDLRSKSVSFSQNSTASKYETKVAGQSLSAFTKSSVPRLRAHHALPLPLSNFCLAKSEWLRQRHGNLDLAFLMILLIFRAAHRELPCWYLNQLHPNRIGDALELRTCANTGAQNNIAATTKATRMEFPLKMW